MFLLIIVFEGVCGASGVPGRQRFDCTFTNEVVSVTCSFDGGEAEDCSLPLVVDFARFGTDNHSVVLTATDEFGQTTDISLFFRLTPRKSRLLTLDISQCVSPPLLSHDCSIATR